MSESRICPVCENEIPQHIKVMCPNCDFYMYMMDDEVAIENAKQNIDRVKNKNNIVKNFLVGVGVILVIFCLFYIFILNLLDAF